MDIVYDMILRNSVSWLTDHIAMMCRRDHWCNIITALTRIYGNPVSKACNIPCIHRSSHIVLCGTPILVRSTVKQTRTYAEQIQVHTHMHSRIKHTHILMHKVCYHLNQYSNDRFHFL